jgi:hypothetical protein
MALSGLAGTPQAISTLIPIAPQTLLDILKRAGGWNPGLYLKIKNAPYMALVIEATDESGPSGLPAISVAHYGEQNGDLMRDPEICFELGLVLWFVELFVVDFEAIFVVGCGRADSGDNVSDRTQASS